MTEGKWYENTDFVDKFKIEFEKAGLPLEYKARKIFEERGFKTHSSHYKVPIDNVLDSSITEKEGTWRQIDINASGFDDINWDVDLTFDKFSLNLSVNFLGECKFSSDKSYFLFRSNEDTSLKFPLNICGDTLLKYEFLEKIFNFNLYENIVEVNVTNFNKKNDNYDDKITHQACEQLFYAASYDILSTKNELKKEISKEISKTQLFKKWIKFLSKNKIQEKGLIDWRNRVKDSIATKFLEEHFELDDIKEIQRYFIYLQFPILIINEGARLFEVELDGKNNIVGFNKIKFGIYNNYHFEKSKNLNSIYPDNIDILICDVSYLSEAIEIILKGFKKLCENLKQKIDERPYLLGYELLFNPDIINPRDYFNRT
jgi:hypothetical protein